MSVDIGCVRITEKFLHSDPPAPEELTNALTVVRDYLDDVVRDIPAAADARLPGRAWPAPSPPWPRWSWASTTTATASTTSASPGPRWRTCSAPWPPRPGPSGCTTPAWRQARADVIVGGVVILVAIMRYFGFDECLVSEADILDGLVLSLSDGA